MLLQIYKFKDALKRHGVQTESCGTKGLGAMEESEYKSVAPHTDVPNASDASPNMDTDDGPVGPNNE